MKLYERTEWKEGDKTIVHYDLRPTHRALDVCFGVSMIAAVLFCALAMFRARRLRK